MGLGVERFLEIIKPAKVTIGATLIGGLLTVGTYVDHRNITPQIAKISAEANAVHPDISAADSQKIIKVDLVKLTKLDVIQAKDLIDQHQAYLTEFDNRGGSLLNTRDDLDITVGIVSGAIAATLGLITIVHLRLLRTNWYSKSRTNYSSF